MADIRDHGANTTFVVQVVRGRRDSAQRTLRRTTLLLCARNGSRGNNLLGQAIFLGRVFLSSLQGPARRKAVRHDFEKSGNSLVNFV